MKSEYRIVEAVYNNHSKFHVEFRSNDYFAKWQLIFDYPSLDKAKEIVDYLRTRQEKPAKLILHNY